MLIAWHRLNRPSSAGRQSVHRAQRINGIQRTPLAIVDLPAAEPDAALTISGGLLLGRKEIRSQKLQVHQAGFGYAIGSPLADSLRGDIE